MWAGVGKSGSPAPNPIDVLAGRLQALALASTARVAEGAMAASRCETAASRSHRARNRRRIPASIRVERAVPPTPSDDTTTNRPSRHVDRSTKREGTDVRSAGPLPCWRPWTPRTSRSPTDCCPPTAGSAAARRRFASEQIEAIVAGATTIMGTSHRKPQVKNLVGSVRVGPDRPVLAARRLGDRARQRRHDGVLGRGDVRAGRRSAASTWCSASSRRSSPTRVPPRRTSATRRSSSERHRRSTRAPVAEAGHRPLRAHPQRDLDRRRDAARRGPSAPTPERSSPSTRRRAPAGCAGHRARSTSTTSPRRSASPPTAVSGSPPARRPRSSGSSGSRPATGGARPRSTSGIALDEQHGRTRRTTRRRSPPC